MSNQIGYVLVIASANYKQPIFSVLRQEDIAYQDPLSENENFLEYIKKNNARISDYDAVIIDLGAVSDSDADIMTALETIRFLDDHIRLIILSGARPSGYAILHQCFLNGIYNLIESTSDYIDLKNDIRKCITDDGMSYKDASVYRSEQKKQIKEVESVRRQKIKIRATQHRAGATHCAIMTAYTLRKSGYLVALADLSESRDYQSIMRSYDRDDSQGFFTLFDIDIYLSMDTLVEQDYQFIVYDCGVHVNDIDADKNIIITGSKPWELIPLQRTLQAIKDIDAYLFLFNYTDPELEEDVKNMMRDVGVNDDKVFFLEMQSYLKESNVMRKIINVSDSEKKPKKKTWIFGKGR